MIKMFCDRCKKEIKDKYYTMSFTEHYTNSFNKVSDIAKISDTLTTICTCIEPTELEKLNSKKVYCDKCRKEIEEMDLGCDTNPKSLIEALAKDDKFEKLVKDMAMKKS